MEDGLENYYPGDSNWQSFVEICLKNWERCYFKNELINELNCFEDIAIVIFLRMGKNSLSWIKDEIPALEFLTPQQCTKDEKLVKRLKTALLRMH